MGQFFIIYSNTSYRNSVEDEMPPVVPRRDSPLIQSFGFNFPPHIKYVDVHLSMILFLFHFHGNTYFEPCARALKFWKLWDRLGCSAKATSWVFAEDILWSLLNFAYVDDRVLLLRGRRAFTFKPPSALKSPSILSPILQMHFGKCGWGPFAHHQIVLHFGFRLQWMQQLHCVLHSDQYAFFRSTS